jgi:hypothetical protein
MAGRRKPSADDRTEKRMSDRLRAQRLQLGLSLRELAEAD